VSGLAPWIARGAALAIGVAIVVGVLAFAWAAAPVLVLMFVAVILGAALQPIVGWLRDMLPIARGAAILLVYGAFLASVVALAFIVLPIAIEQFGDIMAALPAFLDQAREWATTLQSPALSRAVTSVVDLAARSLPPPDSAPEGEEIVAVGVTVAGAVMSLLTLLTVVYFWLTEHARLQRYALAFIPQRRRGRARDVWDQAESRLGRWVRAQLILMATLGIGTGIAYTLLGVPSAVLLALWAALAEAIPIIGPLLGAIPAVLVATTVSPQLALIVAGVYLVLQIIEGNILVPIVMRNTVGISPFLVMLSVLAGAAAGGFVGALLAVPIAATAEILLEGLQAREVPVAQDPASGQERENAEETDEEAAPDKARAQRRAPPDAATPDQSAG
jgi:predicted PurR-regulated permease PerM